MLYTLFLLSDGFGLVYLLLQSAFHDSLQLLHSYELRSAVVDVHVLCKAEDE